MNKDMKNNNRILASKEEELIVVYTVKGIPLTVSEYKEILQSRINDVRNGTAKTYTSEEVLNNILKR